MKYRTCLVFLLLLFIINISLADGDDSEAECGSAGGIWFTGDMGGFINMAPCCGDDIGETTTTIPYEWTDFPHKSEYLDGDLSTQDCDGAGGVCASGWCSCTIPARCEWGCWAADTSFELSGESTLYRIHWEATDFDDRGCRHCGEYEIKIDGTKINSSESEGMWWSGMGSYGQPPATHILDLMLEASDQMVLSAGTHTLEVYTYAGGGCGGRYVNDLILYILEGAYDDAWYSGTVGVDASYCCDGLHKTDIDDPACEDTCIAAGLTWFTGDINGDASNSPCCGDDGESDNFYTGTAGIDLSVCLNGAIESNVDNMQKIHCETNPDFAWMEEAAGTNGPCCGDDGYENFKNSSHKCENNVFSYLSEPDGSQDTCESYGFEWLEEATGIYAPCCGDDGNNDDFNNPTYQCVNGAKIGDLDESKTACTNKGYIWMEGAAGENAPCCGDDVFENFSNSTHKCENNVFSFLSELDASKDTCESLGFTWLEGAAGENSPCCGDDDSENFSSSTHRCLDGILTSLEEEEVCGNNICAGNETSETCCKDCGCDAGYVCQDNTCIEEPEECIQECSFIDGGICCSGLEEDENKCIKCDGKIQSSDCEGNGLCKSICGADSECNNKIPDTDSCDENCNYIGVVDQDSSESACNYIWVGGKCCGDDESDDDYIYLDGMCLNGIAYPCGVEDDMCPEDFNATCVTEDADCLKIRPAFLDMEITLLKEIYESSETLDFQIKLTNYGDESAESISRYQILKYREVITEKQESKTIEKEEILTPELTLPQELEPAEYSLYTEISYNNKTLTREVPIYIKTLCVDIIPKELYIISNEERVIRIRIKNTCDFPLYNYTVEIPEFEYSSEFKNITKHKDIPLITARLDEGDHIVNVISKYMEGATTNILRIRSTSPQTISSQINTLLSEISTKIKTSNMQIGTILSEAEKTKLLEGLNSIKKLKSNAEIESTAKEYTEAQITLYLADDLMKDFDVNLASKLSKQYQFYALIGVLFIGIIVGIVIIAMVVKKKFKFERKEKEEKEEEYKWE